LRTQLAEHVALEAAASFAVQVVREVKPDETADIVIMGEGFALATIAFFHADLDEGFLQSLAGILVYWRFLVGSFDGGSRQCDVHPCSVDYIPPVRVFRIFAVDAQDDVMRPSTWC
jgi:hypothetical protein